MKLPTFLLGCSILLLSTAQLIELEASKKKSDKQPKQLKQLKQPKQPKQPKLPKQPKPPKPSKKQGQCLTSDYLEARAAVVSKELSGEYFICSYSMFDTLYINGTFYEYPFFSSEDKPNLFTISSVNSTPHTNLALFNIGYSHSTGPLYNNSVAETYFIGKWDFVDEELVQVPANNDGSNYRVSKSLTCRRYRMYGYPGRTLYCKMTSIHNDVDDLPEDFDTNDEEPRNTHVYSSIQTWYLVPTEFGGCPCVAEDEQFDYDNNTVPDQLLPFLNGMWVA